MSTQKYWLIGLPRYWGPIVPPELMLYFLKMSYLLKMLYLLKLLYLLKIIATKPAALYTSDYIYSIISNHIIVERTKLRKTVVIVELN